MKHLIFISALMVLFFNPLYVFSLNISELIYRHNSDDIMGWAERGDTRSLNKYLKRNKELQDRVKRGRLKEDNAEVVSLPRRIDVNRQDKNGWTPLMLATVRGRTEFMKILIREGANIEAKNKYGETALFQVASNGMVGPFRVLMHAGANINHQNKYGETLLMKMAYENNSGEQRYKTLIAIITATRKTRNKLETQNNFGWTALMYATLRYNTGWYSEKNPNASVGQIAANMHLRNLETRTLKALIQYKANVNHRAKGGLTPAKLAVLKGGKSSEAYKILVDNGAEEAPKYISSNVSLSPAIYKLIHEDIELNHQSEVEAQRARFLQLQQSK